MGCYGIPVVISLGLYLHVKIIPVLHSIRVRDDSGRNHGTRWTVVVTSGYGSKATYLTDLVLTRINDLVQVTDSYLFALCFRNCSKDPPIEIVGGLISLEDKRRFKFFDLISRILNLIDLGTVVEVAFGWCYWMQGKELTLV
ncbi:hypothetical protein LIA77_06043 [Sarocladium implicatum]|nr:hypothetical protein LIA77_06043 [Sarocladium implicatum]